MPGASASQDENIIGESGWGEKRVVKVWSH